MTSTSSSSGPEVSGPETPGAGTPARIARGLVREAWKATLATIARQGGHPYGSLVAVACEPDGAPLLLLSGLAEHTKNLEADPRVSLLVDGTGRGQGALTGARVTLVGTLVETQSETARRRYLARHPDAARFIDFGDFKLYALDVAWAHLVAGFGRIDRLQRQDVVAPTTGAEALIEAEPDILQHMNDDHSDAIQLMAERFGDGGTGADTETGGHRAPCRMVGCDPEGIDLVSSEEAVRIFFLHRVNSPDEVRRALAAMVTDARLKAGRQG